MASPSTRIWCWRAGTARSVTSGRRWPPSWVRRTPATSLRTLDTKLYVGRFAPSPTGPLHFGSLIAAMASHADARFNDGQWLLRIEDLDPPRESKTAAATFPVVLERYGFEWDGTILYQSTRSDAYAAALDSLLKSRLAFECSCTRSDLADAPIGAGGERIYPGTCRDVLVACEARPHSAWRLRVDDAVIAFVDRIQGRQQQRLAADVGDFVVRRADGHWAYQLAVVVDDRDQGVTDVVRGTDLLASTPRQIFLQRHLGAIEPRYAHIPVAVNRSGEKLSKQTLAVALPATDPVPVLLAAWRFLGQAEPEAMPASAHEFWSWAISRWDIGRIDPRPRSAPTVVS